MIADPRDKKRPLVGELQFDLLGFNWCQVEALAYTAVIHVDGVKTLLSLRSSDLTTFAKFRAAAMKKGVVVSCRTVTDERTAQARQDEWDRIVECASKAVEGGDC